MQTNSEPSTDGVHGVVVKLANDIIYAVQCACAVLDTNRPPLTGNVRFDESIDGIALAFCKTVDSAALLFSRGDHGSAGAVARKALEIGYALVILRKKGTDAIPLFDLQCRQLIGTGLKAVLASAETPSVLDRAKIEAAKKALQAQAPDGKLRLIREDMLASWAGLSLMHEKFYPMLNQYVHFDYLATISLRNQTREPYADDDTAFNLVVDRVEVAFVLLEVTMLALHALRELGARGIDEIINDLLQQSFKDWDDQVAMLVQARGLRNARKSGWQPD